MEEKPLLTVLFLGDAAVGKTSIIYKQQKQIVDPMTTINTATFTVNVNGTSILIYDTAGQERFRSTSTFFYKQASVAVLIFDVSNVTTFHNLEYWINSLQECAGQMRTILVGNKIDLGQVIPEKEISQLSSRLNCEYFFTSATTGFGIDELFNKIAEMASQINSIIETCTEDQVDISICENENEKSKCC